LEHTMEMTAALNELVLPLSSKDGSLNI
jgi:hypothetical protein